MNAQTTSIYDENRFETTLSTGKKDSKGREVGYTVGLTNDETSFFAYVQNARRVNGEWQDFGVMQGSKKFKTQEEARRWAYHTAKTRVANYNA